MRAAADFEDDHRECLVAMLESRYAVRSVYYSHPPSALAPKPRAISHATLSSKSFSTTTNRVSIKMQQLNETHMCLIYFDL